MTPFEWASQHIHIVGWGTVITFIGWVWRSTLKAGILTATARQRADVAMGQIDSMATNHLPHMERDISELNQKHDESTRILQSIDRGIAVLVDRGRNV